MTVGSTIIAPIVGAYLLGSISFSYLIVRMMLGIDIRTVGSGNAGATNVLRVAGKLPAAVALFLDIGKGVAAVLLARQLGAPPGVVAAVGVAAVVGHLYPVFFGFRGGKGVATASGTLIALAPAAMIFCLVVFVVLVAWKRYVSLGSIVAASLCPLVVALLGRSGWLRAPWGSLALASAAIALLVVWKHRENITRLRCGTEKKLGQKATAS